MRPYKHAEGIRVVYDKQRWKLLTRIREAALKTMKVFVDAKIFCSAHGSIARGDVDVNSDVDIFIPNPPSSFVIETTLRRSGETVNRRFLIQATPNYAPKAYLELNSETTISFPLTKLRATEREFYIFSGEATFEQLINQQRVSGVDKRLMLIQPNDEGHVESSIVGQEQDAAKILSISLNAVLDRTRALTRRGEIGKTGVFIKKALKPDESFEFALKKLENTNPAVRRRLKLKKR